MCTEPLYALILKEEFDPMWKRFKKHSPIKVLGSVRSYEEKGIKPRLDDARYNVMMISCGQCMQCRLIRAKNKAVQACAEAYTSDESCFITLTFGYEQLYNYFYYEKGYSRYLAKKYAHYHEWTLENRLFANFIKKLRFWYYQLQLRNFLVTRGYSHLIYTKNGKLKSHIRCPKELLIDFNPKKLRYLHCGEYGGKNQRPHHHLILFGLDFTKMYGDVIPFTCSDGKIIKRSQTVEKLWNLGFTDVGSCCYETCQYVSRYVTKKAYGNNVDKIYNGRKPEFTTQSSKPALGTQYFLDNIDEFCNTGEITVRFSDKTVTSGLTRTFMNLLKKVNFDRYLKVSKKRFDDSQCDMEKLFNSERSIYAKLDSNDKIAFSVFSSIKRSLEDSYHCNNKVEKELYKKLKAFGLVNKYVNVYSNVIADKLAKKNYKNLAFRSTNKELHQKYVEFENKRKRVLNKLKLDTAYLNYSDEKYIDDEYNIKSIVNPYKVKNKGVMYSVDEDENIDIYNFTVLE